MAGRLGGGERCLFGWGEKRDGHVRPAQVYRSRRRTRKKRGGVPGKLVLGLSLGCLILIQPVEVHSQEEGGTLQELRESVRDPDRRSGESGSGAASELWGFVFLVTVGSGIWLPIALLDTNWEAAYLGFPYEDGYPGYYVLAPRGYRPADDHEELDPHPAGSAWAGRLAVEATSYNEDIEGYGIQSRVSLPFGLEVEARGEQLLEDLPGGGRDDLWLGQGGVGWSFARSRNTRFFFGAGPTILADSEATDYGWYVQYGAETFPREPLRLEALIEGGRIGHAGFWRGRVQAGVHWNRWEVFGGFRYQSIGNVDLYGPSAGVQFWF